MILTEQPTSTVEGSIFEGRVSTINQDKSAKLFRILSGLYSDIKSSIIREYVSNALDSITKVGTDEPILIDIRDNKLTITDFGVGLSEEEMYNVYINFLTSTKEDSNDFIGSFGLGSKCALNYTDSFNIISTKNGITSHYIYFKNNLGLPELNKLISLETEDRNGVKIEIPINENDKALFLLAVKNQLYYFPNVYLTTDNERYAEEFNNREFTDFGDFYKHNDSTCLRGLTITMGGVIYRINDKLINTKGLNNIDGISIKFNIGEITPIPSREDIDYTNTNIDTINNKIELIYNKIVDILRISVVSDENTSNYIDFKYGDRSMAIYRESPFLSYAGLEPKLKSIDITWRVFKHLVNKIDHSKLYSGLNKTPYLYTSDLKNYTIIYGNTPLQVKKHNQFYEKDVLYVSKHKYRMFIKDLKHCYDYYCNADLSVEKVKILRNLIVKYLSLNFIPWEKYVETKEYKDILKEFEEEALNKKSSPKSSKKVIVEYIKDGSYFKTSINYYKIFGVGSDSIALAAGDASRYEVIMLDNNEELDNFKHLGISRYIFMYLAPLHRKRLEKDYPDRVFTIDRFLSDKKLLNNLSKRYLSSTIYMHSREFNIIEAINKDLYYELDKYSPTNYKDSNSIHRLSTLHSKYGNVLNKKHLDKSLELNNLISTYKSIIERCARSNYYSIDRYDLISVILRCRFKKIPISVNYNYLRKIR